MIIRSAFRCATCGQDHTVRIGMGQGNYQEHVFSCANCSEEMKIGMKVDYKNISTEQIGIKNAELSEEASDAPIVNVDANFTVPTEMTNTDFTFHRLTQMQEMIIAATEKGALETIPVKQLNIDEATYTRDDFEEEWKALQKALSLHKNGKAKLSSKKVEDASKTYYSSEQLDDVEDWFFRFSMKLGQPHFEPVFMNVFEELSHIVKSSETAEFWEYYEEHMVEQRAKLYFDIFKDFFENFSEFSQVYYRVSLDLGIPEDHVATSVKFDAVRAFYGNAYETFTSLVDILAFFNNLKMGRAFGEFQTLTLSKYSKLDKSSKCTPFILNAAFMGVCKECDNQIRNASHHRNIHLSKDRKTISYKAGKGGTGTLQSMSYADYLYRSTILFLQIVVLLRVELALCSNSKKKYPV